LRSPATDQRERDPGERDEPVRELDDRMLFPWVGKRRRAATRQWSQPSLTP
jgi:hypothetical protein